VDTSAAFFLSIEFQETGYLVERFYKAAYGDASGARPLVARLPVPMIRFASFSDAQKSGRSGCWPGLGENCWKITSNPLPAVHLERQQFTGLSAELSAERFVSRLSTLSARRRADA
jgi:hypothetical protein